MKEEMMKKIEKWQEPPPAKTAKVLPVPDAEMKKKRGGKRYRKMKVGAFKRAKCWMGVWQAATHRLVDKPLLTCSGDAFWKPSSG
jgi:hypothetical protein